MRSILISLGVIGALGCTTPRLLAVDAAHGNMDAAARDASEDAELDAPSAPVDAQPAIDAPDPVDAFVCREARESCADTAQCCGDLECGATSEGMRCCGLEHEPCSDTGGRDCCGEYDCEQHEGAGPLHCCSWVGGACSDDQGCCGYHPCVGGVCQ